MWQSHFRSLVRGRLHLQQLTLKMTYGHLKSLVRGQYSLQQLTSYVAKPLQKFGSMINSNESGSNFMRRTLCLRVIS